MTNMMRFHFPLFLELERNDLFFKAALTLLACSSAQAGSCVIAKFVKKGAQFGLLAGMMETTVTIVEIDKKSCWIKVKKHGGSWINLNTITLLTPKN